MKISRFAIIAAPLALLAGCGGGDEQPIAADEAVEVLEPAVSDAMLPLAELRSQPPLADPEEAERAASSNEEDTDVADATPAPEPTREPEPASQGEDVPADALDAIGE